nr:MAG TPA: endopeptidase tail [Caudoviricetes sp.]
MYSVYLDGEIMLQSGSDKIPIIDGNMRHKLSSTAEWDISVLPTNPRYGDIMLRKSIVEVKQDGVSVWRGCVIEQTKNFLNTKILTLANELSFLQDTRHDPFTFDGTPQRLLLGILNGHNERCDENKKLALGTVFGLKLNQYNVKYETFETHFDILKDARDAVGGYLIPRRVDGTTYIDWLGTLPCSGQRVEFGKNLIDLEDVLDTSDAITCLYPVGKDGLTISAVNGGQTWIQNSARVMMYGKIFGVENFSDIEDAAELLAAGKEALNSAPVEGRSIKLSAVDLHTLGLDENAIEVGMSVHVYSRPHGLDAVMPVTEKEQSLVSASDCTITLGSDNAKISDQRGMVTGREFKAAAANTRKSISNTASIANSAKSAANSAQATAESASGIAESAKTIATDAKAAADAAMAAAEASAPKNHAVSATTFGAGTSANYGHVRLSDATGSTSAASGGTAATPAAVKAAYDLASQASSAASSAYDLANEAGQVATDAAQTAADAQSAAEAAQAAVGGKAPKAHASTATTYGKGTLTNYGHVKLSDSILSTSDTDGGTAATPGAVKKAYDLANRAETTLLGGKKIVCGWSAVSFKSTGQTNTTINFGTTFTAKPIVIIGQPFNGVICTVFKDAVTTTKFTVNVPAVGSSTVSTRQMAWVAIGSV